MFHIDHLLDLDPEDKTRRESRDRILEQLKLKDSR
jgi:hypothetical protein